MPEIPEFEGQFTMSIQRKIKNGFRLLFDPDFRFGFMAGRGFYDSMPDRNYLERIYKIHHGKSLDLDNPVTYTEKLQWLKLYDHRPVYTTMVDKYEVKKFVADRIGEQYVIPLLGVWDSFDEIDFDALPEKFVLKCTHDSGTLVICKDKSTFDREAAGRKFARFMKRDYYSVWREWPYKNVRRRIIAEQYMEDSGDGELRDYKFFTFGGVPKVLYIAQGRGRGEPTVADFFDMEFNHLPFTIDHDMAEVPPHPPENFRVMQCLAAELSRGTPQLRVDFYEVDGKVYFGEMTFFHCSGLEKFHPESWDRTFGDWVTLPEKTTEE